jgi:hypothetical protein
MAGCGDQTTKTLPAVDGERRPVSGLPRRGSVRPRTGQFYVLVLVSRRRDSSILWPPSGAPLSPPSLKPRHQLNGALGHVVRFTSTANPPEHPRGRPETAPTANQWRRPDVTPAAPVARSKFVIDMIAGRRPRRRDDQRLIELCKVPDEGYIDFGTPASFPRTRARRWTVPLIRSTPFSLPHPPPSQISSASFYFAAHQPRVRARPGCLPIS